MRCLGILFLSMAVLSLSACSGKKDEKTPAGKDGKDGPKELTAADKIVGSWEGTSGDYKGIVIDYTKDGKIKTTPPGTEPGMEGTYKVDGETVEITFKKKGAPAKLKIKTLSETTLILDDNGKESEFKKK